MLVCVCCMCVCVGVCVHVCVCVCVCACVTCMYKIYFAEIRVATLDQMQKKTSANSKSGQSSKYKGFVLYQLTQLCLHSI